MFCGHGALFVILYDVTLFFSTNPTVVRSGSTLTTSSTSTATSSISTMSTDFDQSESGSIPEVPSRRPRDSKMERPQSWVAKFFPGSRRNEPDSPQQPRRKTIDVAGEFESSLAQELGTGGFKRH